VGVVVLSVTFVGVVVFSVADVGVVVGVVVDACVACVGSVVFAGAVVVSWLHAKTIIATRRTENNARIFFMVFPP
jgi:hypothetical protein